MPRKTRKQKMIAEERKKVVAPLAFNFSAMSLKQKTAPVEPSFVFIRNDIRKTLALGSIFILIEFFLAFFSKNLGW